MILCGIIHAYLAWDLLTEILNIRSASGSERSIICNLG
jgi:hypothetical protein